MAEDTVSENPLTEPYSKPPLDPMMVLEKKENSVSTLSAAIAGVFNEIAKDPELSVYSAEHTEQNPVRCSPESQPLPVPQEPINFPTDHAPSPQSELIKNEISTDNPDKPLNTTSSSTLRQETESSKPPEGYALITLTPIPENSPPSTAPESAAPRAFSPVAPGVAPSVMIPSESEITPAGGPTIPGSIGDPGDRVGGAEKMPVLACPIEEPPKPDGLFSITDDISPKTPAVPSSERLSLCTALNVGTPIGSTNELFLSTKASNENAVEPKPNVSRQSSSNAVPMVFQKLMDSSILGEEAMKALKDVSDEMFKDKIEEPKIEQQNLGTFLEESKPTIVKKSALNLEHTIVKEETITTVLSAKEIVGAILEETSEETSHVNSEETAMESPPLNPVVPPIVVENPDECIIDIMDTSVDVQNEAEVLKPVIVTSHPVPDSVAPTKAEDKVAKPADKPEHPIGVVQKEVAAAQAEVKVAKPAEKPEHPIRVVQKEVADISQELSSEESKEPIVSDEVFATKEKPTSEVPVRRKDSSKDAPKKQTSKNAGKTVETTGKTSRVPPQPPPTNSGQTGAIAATSSASATSALSPRSDKSVKQIKSPRPVSARSARGYPVHGDLSSSNSVLGVMTSQLTGPQRVAAARAAASAAGIKTRKVMSGTASVPMDGNKSPRDKQSVISTVSNAPAATSSSATSGISSGNPPAVQKRTSALSGSSSTTAQTHPTAARRGATGSNTTNDGHRAAGHSGPSHLGIHASNQRLKSSSDIISLEATYSAILKSFIDTKKELQLKTKLAREMFAEIEKLRHLASIKFGKDLPLNEDITGLAEAAIPRTVTGAAGEMFSEDGNRTIVATESILTALIAQRTQLLNETSQHYANLLAWCCEAAGDDGAAKTPKFIGEREFVKQLAVRVAEVCATEQTHVAEVLQVLRTSLSDLEASKASCRDLRSQLELLNQENSNLTNSLADCTKELEDSRTEFGKVAARKVAAEKEAKLLRIKLKEMENKITAEEQKCKDLTSQVRSLEDKVRSKDTTQEQRMRDTERKMRERLAKEHEELQRRLDEALKKQKIKESKLEETCLQLDSKLGSVTQLLEMETKDKERIEVELKATAEKLSRITMERLAETEELRQEREALVERLHNMVANEVTPNGHQLKAELQALSDLLDDRERLIEEKNAEIKRLKDSSMEGADSEVSKEEFIELQGTLKKLATHNQMLEQELSKMVQSAAKRDRVMGEQEKVLLIRDQLIALLQCSNHASANGAANPRDVAVQQKMLDLQTTIERQTVRIKALETQLAETEKHHDGLQSLRTRYERRIAQLEHALSDQRGAQKSETLSKIRTLLHGNLGQ